MLFHVACSGELLLLAFAGKRFIYGASPGSSGQRTGKPHLFESNGSRIHLSLQCGSEPNILGGQRFYSCGIERHRHETVSAIIRGSSSGF